MAAIPALFGLLMAAAVTGQVVEIHPASAVVRAGSDVTVLCRVPYNIDSCRMTVGGVSYRLRPEEQGSGGEVVYAGEGLGRGECGARIAHVRAEWSGDVTCVLPPPAGSIELTASMQLIVAQAPDAPLLEAGDQPAYREGERLEARCTVAHARPAARIAWFLDDEPVLVGTHQPVEVAGDAGLVTVSQNLTRVLGAGDAGRTLVCRAMHEALDQPLQATRQLVVHFPPRRADGGEGSQLTIFGLKLGAEGRLNVTLRASPPPSLQWRVADQTLAAGQTSSDGRFMATELIPLGSHWYNATLVVSRLSKEDVDRGYLLTATNDLGAEDCSVRISTMDEPQGVELDAGAIVGIVVGALVLLLAVSLAVFARATERWCFAGGAREAGKSSGESSDTESAAGGGSRGVTGGGGRLAALGALGARVRAALPRPRDKVTQAHAVEHSAEAAGDKALAEEKKGGVVYAELALGERAGGEDKPPAPAHSAEYAEIVYTEQQGRDAHAQ